MIEGLDVHKSNFSKSMTKYKYWSSLESEAGTKKIEKNMIFFKEFCSYIWRNVSLIFGSIGYISINLVLAFSCISNRNLDVVFELNKGDF